MTRAEYLKALGAALRKQHVADVQDILSEYDDHFVCKLADGYSEEEISARLGDPAAVVSCLVQIPAGCGRSGGAGGAVCAQRGSAPRQQGADRDRPVLCRRLCGCGLRPAGRICARAGRVRAYQRGDSHAPLPALPIAPQLCPWDRRRLRTAALIALIIFAAAFVLGIFVSIVSAGSFQFWHVWGWFGYGIQMWQ